MSVGEHRAWEDYDSTIWVCALYEDESNQFFFRRTSERQVSPLL